MKDDEVFAHPSYGMVSFHRVTSSGKNTLFGSALAGHYHTIVLRVHAAEMRIDRSLHMERPRATKQIVEVELSAAQFAELLTTMNVGDGVPCTLRRVHGEAMPNPPAVPVESVNVRTDFEAKMSALRPNLEHRAKSILDALPNSLNKGTRRQIEIGLGNLVEAVAGDATFALDQFQEAASRVTAAAKAEVDAVVTHVVQATGIKALAEMRERGEVPELPEKAASQPQDEED